MKPDLHRIPFCASLCLFAFSLHASSGDVLQAGQAAPSFRLPSQDGTEVALNDFHGKWVVLYFYPKDNTPGCTIEAHNFQRDLPKYETYGAVIVGVSVDSVDSHKGFCAQQSLTFKLLSDPEGNVVEEYGSERPGGSTKMALRNTFLINPEGKIVKAWTAVDPKHHSEDVLATLSDLQGKK
jgi:peroxiredoxin Q/BCP